MRENIGYNPDFNNNNHYYNNEMKSFSSSASSLKRIRLAQASIQIVLLTISHIFIFYN
jgi:hypothetical protein